MNVSTMPAYTRLTKQIQPEYYKTRVFSRIARSVVSVCSVCARARHVYAKATAYCIAPCMRYGCVYMECIHIVPLIKNRAHRIMDELETLQTHTHAIWLNKWIVSIWKCMTFVVFVIWADKFCIVKSQRRYPLKNVWFIEDGKQQQQKNHDNFKHIARQSNPCSICIVMVVYCDCGNDLIQTFAAFQYVLTSIEQ